MQIEKINISKLNPAKYNPRKDLKPGDTEYEKLKRSIDGFGYVEPIIWNRRTGNIIGGHQRYKVLKSMGLSEVKCVVLDLDEVKEKALNVALNKIGGEFDIPLLTDLLKDLSDSDFDATLTGFDLTEIDELFSKSDDTEGKDDGYDVTKALEEASFVSRGDVVAKCEVKMPEEIYRAIEKLTQNQEEILTFTLKAGGEVVLNAVRSNLNRAIRNSSNRSTGELKSSLGMSPVKLSSRGIYNVKIGFAEPRRKQYVAKKKRSYYVITNAMIANVLEYGKTGQAPRPFMRPAKVASEKAAISAMKAKFDEEVKKRRLK